MADQPKASAPTDTPEWATHAMAYRQRLERFLAPRLRRARTGDPVPEFLFSYYGLRPGRLRCWHPGLGSVLRGPEAVQAYHNRSGYIVDGDEVRIAEAHVRQRRNTVGFIVGLLRAIAGRSARLNCFGLHEWAMVYRLHSSDAVRHSHIPLRMSPADIDRTVESLPLRCTHFDAYRFFTRQAAPRNELELDRAGQIDREQPGCLHANMDLFKWAYKLTPLVDSDFVLDCLELAATAREIDMRASPYDLRVFSYPPIAVETAEGRSEYVREQGAVMRQAAPLRSALLSRCERILEVADG